MTTFFQTEDIALTPDILLSDSVQWQPWPLWPLRSLTPRLRSGSDNSPSLNARDRPLASRHAESRSRSVPGRTPRNSFRLLWVFVCFEENWGKRRENSLNLMFYGCLIFEGSSQISWIVFIWVRFSCIYFPLESLRFEVVVYFIFI